SDAVKVGHPEGKSGVTGVAISPDGQWALATKRFEDSVALLRIDGTQVTYIAERDVFEVRSGPRTGDIAVGSNPRAVAMSPLGRGRQHRAQFGRYGQCEHHRHDAHTTPGGGYLPGRATTGGRGDLARWALARSGGHEWLEQTARQQVPQRIQQGPALYGARR